MASYQQSVRIDTKRCAGDQRYIVLAVLNLQQARVRRQDCVDSIHLIGQYLAQNVDIKDVAFFELINVRKQLGARHATVGRKYRMGVFSAHRQGCAYHMAHRFFQRVGFRSVLYRQVYTDLGDVHIRHDTTHGKLICVGQGRGGCPSLRDRRIGQHGVILLRRLPLGGQFSIVSIFDSCGVGSFHIGVVLFT